MTPNDKQVHQALAILEQVANTPEEYPAVVVVPSEGGDLIKGNQAGLLRIAISALKASTGKDQRFENATVIVQDEYGSTIDGIGLDNYAHYDLPKKFTRWERIKSSIILFVVVAIVAVIFLAGTQTAGHWLWRLIFH